MQSAKEITWDYAVSKLGGRIHTRHSGTRGHTHSLCWTVPLKQSPALWLPSLSLSTFRLRWERLGIGTLQTVILHCVDFSRLRARTPSSWPSDSWWQKRGLGGSWKACRPESSQPRPPPLSLWWAMRALRSWASDLSWWTRDTGNQRWGEKPAVSYTTLGQGQRGEASTLSKCPHRIPSPAVGQVACLGQGQRFWTALAEEAPRLDPPSSLFLNFLAKLGFLTQSRYSVQP